MDSDELARALIGTTVADKYRVLDVLGTGGMGTVYLAEHVFTKRRVALKRMHPELGRSKLAAERFIRESQAPSTIGHPGIVQVLDGGSQPDGSLYIVHELLEGVSMSEAIERCSLTPNAVIQLGIELLQALAAAHAKGIIHRDIKPDNVFIAQDGSGGVCIKLLDFGIASLRDTRDGDKLTRPGSVLGTAHYMSPEQAMAAPVDERSDLWSVGALLYHALSGELPYPGDTYNAVIYALASKQHIPLSVQRPDLPEALVSVVERALRKLASERFASAKQMAEALAAVSLDGAPRRRTSRRASDVAQTRMDTAPPQPTAAAQRQLATNASLQPVARSGPAPHTPRQPSQSLVKLSVLAGTMLLCTLTWLMLHERDTRAAAGQLTAADALQPELVALSGPDAVQGPNVIPDALPLAAAEPTKGAALDAPNTEAGTLTANMPEAAEVTPTDRALAALPTRAAATPPPTRGASLPPLAAAAEDLPPSVRVTTASPSPAAAAQGSPWSAPLAAPAASTAAGPRGLPLSALAPVLSTRQAELDRCLQDSVVAQLLAGARPAPAYRVDVSLSVAASGQVERVELSGAAPADLSSCLHVQLLAARFPAALSPTEFRYPLVLTPTIVGQ
ncbi:MAG TPA: protein kinase [Polyangiales bacterium]|nr:protein kinase [Polyangiales bacterium]